MEKTCGNVRKIAEKIASNTTYADAEKSRKSSREEITADALDELFQLSVTPRNIPVIINILDHVDENSIADTAITRQIEILNDDFNAANADMGKVPEVFQPFIGNPQISFYLANEGVRRKRVNICDYGNETEMLIDGDDGFAVFEPDKFINIYVCNIDDYGWSSMPWDAPYNPTLDAIAVHTHAFGTQGELDPRTTLGRTLTHEVGHFFGLHHVWGTSDGDVDDEVTPKIFHSCGDTDGIADTPNQYGPNVDLVSHPHRSGNCSGNITGDMFMNFMDIGPDEQLQMFTGGQVTWMHQMLAEYRSQLGVYEAALV